MLNASRGSRRRLTRSQKQVGGGDHVIGVDIISAAYRSKIWTMFKFVDTIYNYRQLYTVKEKVDLEWCALYKIIHVKYISS